MNTVMRCLLTLGVLAAAMLGLTRTAHAQACLALNECYVSPSGNDGAAGTAANPWRTLQYAVDTIEPGGTINVLPGSYRGFRVRLTGTLMGPKTIQATCPAIDPGCAGSLAVINAPSLVSRHASFVEVEQNVADDPAGNVIRYWTIDGFQVSGSQRYGIDLRVTEQITVVNNVVQGSARTGIFFAHSNGTLVENNESRNNGEHGCYAADSSHFPTIRANYLHHNDDSGIHMNGGLGTGAGDGIIEAPLVEQNEIAYNGLGGGAAINCDGVRNGMIRNNMAYKNSASGIALYRSSGAIASSFNKIYDNTFVMANPSRWVVLIFRTGGAGGVGNDIKNNILYTPDPLRGSIATYSTSSSVLTSDYNLVVNRFNTDGAQTSSRITLAQWRARGQDAHSLLVPANLSALFVNPAGGDYHILSGSVAQDNGTFLADVTDDFDGDQRNILDNPYDIGADEIPAEQDPDPEPDACAACMEAVCDLVPFCCSGGWRPACNPLAGFYCGPAWEGCE